MAYNLLSVELGFGNGLLHLAEKFILSLPISSIDNKVYYREKDGKGPPYIIIL